MKSTEQPDKTVDITEPKIVEVLIRDDGRVVWVNVDGICRFRACRIHTIKIEDKRS